MKTKIENRFYVYLHIKEDTGEPFYVGKGQGKRAGNRSRRSNFWKRIVNKHGFDIIFLETNLTEQESLDKEIYWIERIGRRDLGKGPLVNFTYGGDGTSGWKHSKETKLKIGLANKGRKHKEETKLKIGLANKGMIMSNEAKEKISLKNSNPSQETRNKISLLHKGKIISDEIKLKISKTKTGVSSKKKKPVLQIDPITKNIIKEYESLTQAREETKISNIHRCINKKRKTAGNYEWVYKIR